MHLLMRPPNRFGFSLTQTTTSAPANRAAMAVPSAPSIFFAAIVKIYFLPRIIQVCRALLFDDHQLLFFHEKPRTLTNPPHK